MPTKLLVIDDQPGIGAVVSRIAASLGLDTRVVQDPLQAIEEFLEFIPDAVIMDIVMPEKDGIELLEEMILTGHPAKFIIMSGYGDTYLRLARGRGPLSRHEAAACAAQALPPRRAGGIASCRRPIGRVDPAGVSACHCAAAQPGRTHRSMADRT